MLLCRSAWRTMARRTFASEAHPVPSAPAAAATAAAADAAAATDSSSSASKAAAAPREADDDKFDLAARYERAAKPIPLGDPKELREFQATLRQRENVPVEVAIEPFEPFENDVNPNTQEYGGPRSKEPTRFGDWERRGRVTDF